VLDIFFYFIFHFAHLSLSIWLNVCIAMNIKHIEQNEKLYIYFLFKKNYITFHNLCPHSPLSHCVCVQMPIKCYSYILNAPLMHNSFLFNFFSGDQGTKLLASQKKNLSQYNFSFILAIYCHYSFLSHSFQHVMLMHRFRVFFAVAFFLFYFFYIFILYLKKCIDLCAFFYSRVLAFI
jgi:hypothetical protein